MLNYLYFFFNSEESASHEIHREVVIRMCVNVYDVHVYDRIALHVPTTLHDTNHHHQAVSLSGNVISYLLHDTTRRQQTLLYTTTRKPRSAHEFISVSFVYTRVVHANDMMEINIYIPNSYKHYQALQMCITRQCEEKGHHMQLYVHMYV